MAKSRATQFNALLSNIKNLNANLNSLNMLVKRGGFGGTNSWFGVGGNLPGLHSLTSPSFWEGVFKIQDNIRAKALALNTTPNKLAEAAGGGVGRAGYFNAVVNQLEILSTGLETNNDITKELGLQMRVTGQNENKLYQTYRQSQVLGGLSNRQMENLSNHMQMLGETYNISTEALVDSIQQISADMNVNALGLTEDFTKINTDITARFGAGAATLVTQLESQFAAGQTFVTDQLVGAMGGLGNTVESVRQYTTMYADRFGDFVKQFPPQMKAIALQMAKGIYGEQGLLSYNLSNFLNRTVERNQTGQAEDKFSTLQTAIQTIYNPINQLAQNLLPALINSLGALTVATIAAQTYSLAKSAGSSAPALAGLLPALGRFLPYVGAAVAVGGIAYGIYRYFDGAEDRDVQRLDIEKRRLQLEEEAAESKSKDQTAKYMELQSQAINDSIDRIMFNGDLSRRMAAETDKKKIELQEKLIQAIYRLENKGPGPRINNMIGKGA